MDLGRYPDIACANNPENFDERAAREELERLIADSRLHLTERNRAFLRYIAEEAFSGNSRGAKAYSIAVDVFGRPSSFDPSLDPIVRIEAARIRAALDHYYDAHGGPNQIRISLPRGHYIAEFSQIGGAVMTPPQASASATADIPLELPATGADGRRSDTWRRSTLAAGAIAAACVLVSAAIYFLHYGSTLNSGISEKPLVTLFVTTRDVADERRAADVEDGLMLALARFGTLRLATVKTFVPGGPHLAATGAFRDAAIHPSDYQIALKYKVDETARRVTWTVVEPSSGETLASGEEVVPNDSHGAATADEQLVSSLAARFGSPLGLLNNLELHRNGAEEQVNLCVLRGEYALSRGEINDLTSARSCMEAALQREPGNADVNATLARVLVALDEEMGIPANSALALSLANKAAGIAPHSDRALAARMVALYANGRNEAAEEAGDGALAANPLNDEIAGAFALRLYASGAWGKGVTLARRILASSGVANSTAPTLVLALEAYRSGDPQAALVQLDAIVDDNCLASAVRIASLVQLERRREAASSLEDAEKLHHGFPKAIGKILEIRGVEPALAQRLRNDVAAAGMPES